jgi:2-amino-4-hydroxy-6-hydroxymethyldihydropteridine diphosphokinase
VTRVVIALGSNLGDRLGRLRTAVVGLREIGTVISASSLYETEPAGGPDQGRYLNAAVVLDTGLEPRPLLEALLAIERSADRIRDVRWGPRTLDLDIIAYGAETVDEPELTIPHPRARDRRFVLDPVSEIAPNTLVAPGTTAREARRGLPSKGVFRWEGDWIGGHPTLGWRGQALVAGQFALFGVLAVVAVGTADPNPAVWFAVLGIAIALVGGFLVVGAVLGLGTQLSALPDPRPGGALSDRGVFGIVRHPIYGGLFLGGIGTSITLQTWWPLPVLAVLAGLLTVKAGLEERALTLMYPDYAEYASRVRRRFIPFVW